MSGQNTSLVKETTKTEELHHVEAEQQQQQNAAAAAPVEMEQTEGHLEANIHTLRDEEFVELDLPLVHADPVFHNQKSSLFRQRQAHGVGGRKSQRREEARQNAAEQKEMDTERFDTLSTRISALSSNEFSDVIIKRSILSEEAGCCQHQLSERKDVNGVERRRNERRYAKYARINPFSRSAAKEDVQNLVENIRRDLALEGDATVPENLQEYTDAYYFVHKFGNDIARDVTVEMKNAKKNGTISEEEYQQRETRLAKLENFKMIQKSYASNFTPAMMMKAQDIRARKLARQHILDEGNSDYHQMMVDLLDHEITQMEAEYKDLLHWLVTYNDTMDTYRSPAQAAMQKELAAIRREMKRCDYSTEDETEEETAKRLERRDQLEQQGRDLLASFDYPGPHVAFRPSKLGET